MAMRSIGNRSRRPIVVSNELNTCPAIDVPRARSINPVTHTDWEGNGVEPDVPVSAKDALKKAVEMATRKLEGAHQHERR